MSVMDGFSACTIEMCIRDSQKVEPLEGELEGGGESVDRTGVGHGAPEAVTVDGQDHHHRRAGGPVPVECLDGGLGIVHLILTDSRCV